MSRAQRLQPVQRVVDQKERKQAEALAAAERAVAAAAGKLTELESYRMDYARSFSQRAGQGMGARDLHDYQAFMARLQQAIQQQTFNLQRAEQERDAQLKRWQEAAQRCKAVGHVIDHWRVEEQRGKDRREQRESDERAQRRRTTQDS